MVIAGNSSKSTTFQDVVVEDVSTIQDDGLGFKEGNVSRLQTQSEIYVDPQYNEVEFDGSYQYKSNDFDTLVDTIINGEVESEGGSDDVFYVREKDDSYSDVEFWGDAINEVDTLVSGSSIRREESEVVAILAQDTSTVVIITDVNVNLREELVSEDELLTPPGSDDELGSTRQRLPQYNPRKCLDEPELKLGMMFPNAAILRNVLADHSIANNYSIHWILNRWNKMSAVCKAKCGWKLYAIALEGEKTVQIRTFQPDHKCGRAHKSRQCSTKWIAKTYLQMFKDQQLKVRTIQADLMRSYGFNVTSYTIARAIKIMKAEIDGENAKQYEKLRSYAETVLKYNHGTTMKIAVDSSLNPLRPRFQRLYTCFEACRKGFIRGCKPFFGLDGCHIKTEEGGQFLCAVARDVENKLFPLAIAWVEIENQNSWKWFLELLVNDIGLGPTTNTKGWVVMSDRQKGLMRAIQDICPGVEHRSCVRHIHANMKDKHWKGNNIRDCLWGASCAYNVYDHNYHMERLKNINMEAYEYLNSIEKEAWARSYFQTWSKVDLTVNNLCESFNAKILEFRDKPIITSFEGLRRMLITEFQEKKKEMTKWSDLLCPKIKKKIEYNTARIARYCNIIYAGQHMYECECMRRVFTMDLAKKECSCGEFQLSGLPCGHAIAAISYENEQVEKYVHESYTKVANMRIYEGIIHPVPSEEEWVLSNALPMDPPLYRRQSGRPTKKRRRAAHEPQPTKFRRLPTMTCSICKGKGHNKRGCPTKQTTRTNQGEHDEAVDTQMQSQIQQSEVTNSIQTNPTPMPMVFSRKKLVTWGGKCVASNSTTIE